jgi:hypothetical protein
MAFVPNQLAIQFGQKETISGGGGAIFHAGIPDHQNNSKLKPDGFTSNDANIQSMLRPARFQSFDYFCDMTSALTADENIVTHGAAALAFL